jgi:hypothetical protein
MVTPMGPHTGLSAAAESCLGGINGERQHWPQIMHLLYPVGWQIRTIGHKGLRRSLTLVPLWQFYVKGCKRLR